ncbi:uncharacterized protein F4807DRAFT_465484 [Annulohypoxylon truncatum]|uniref:uncharacterized protein n=1 Tax=Annulohypoxylon truncatum TaxID=327061 RepID=UPI0020087F96|nr:uncharacterized protein F4807DRAFT_465484 [Annulohypoxylon truncatum]KAI1204573.1 hypothetical protein F4807DRAFT_465484 [Annulohypoxylon truncatum]
MIMMNGTDVASHQPVSKNVKSPPTHGLTPATGVMLIDRTSCKARKRPRIASSPPPAKYSPSSSSSPSRIAKANKSKRYGPSLSLSSSSPSSLARSSYRKRGGTAADLAAPASISPTETRDEPDVSRHGFPGIKWEYTVPPIHNGELTVSEPRDHFALSSTPLPQTLAHGAHNLPPYNLDLPVFSNSPFSMCHQPVTYLPTHENSPRENLSRDYLTAFPGVTASTAHYNTYPLHQPFEPMNPSNFIAEDPSYLGDNTSGQAPPPFGPDSTCLARPEGNRMDDLNDGWFMVNPEPAMEQQPIEDSGPGNGSGQTSNHQEVDTPSIYNDQMQTSDFDWRDTSAPEEAALEPIGPQIVDEIAADMSGPSSRRERRPRSHLLEEKREWTSKTRKLKCDADPANESGECLKCQSVNPDSKKVIHRLPCLRWKLAEIVLYRDGGLGLTKRWSGVKMKDLAPRDWVDNRIRTITVIIGCRRAPMQLSVRKFTPTNGDVTWKHWVDAQGIRRRIEIEPYALANVWETARQYAKYVTNYALIAVAEYADDPDHHVDDVRNTLQQKGDEVNHFQFLMQYFCLWFATRNMLGSAILVGDETLDMEPVKDEGCPYHGKVFIPRMIPAQFDSIGHEAILASLRKQVLDGLWKMMASKNPRDFFIIYLVVFMLLHEISITSRDRFRRARDNSLDPNRYDLELFVEKLQEGANIILSHWHYYKRDVNDFMTKTDSRADYKEKKKGEKAVWSELDSDEMEFLVETRQAYVEKEEQRSAPMEFEDDLYFVSQMFEEGWRPKPTFVSNGS